MLARLFKRAKRATAGTALPLSVERGLANLSATVRSDHDDMARTMLAWTGEGQTVAWHHSPQETRRRLALAFPDLTPAQLDLACRSVAGLVRTAQQAAPIGTRKGWSAKSWATRSFDNANF